MSDYDRGTIRLDLAEYAQAQVIINLSGDPEFDVETLRNAIKVTCEVLGVDAEGRTNLKARLAAAVGRGAASSPTSAQPKGNGRSEGAQRRSQQQGYPMRLECPKHQGEELRPSVRNKEMDYIDQIDMEIPASWFHTGPDGKSCSSYQSAAIWVMHDATENASGKAPSEGSEYDEDPRDSRQGVGAAPQEDVPVDDAPQPF
jgi:hypothetical protein